MKKSAVVFLLVAMIISLFAGCAYGQPEENLLNPKSPVSITVWTYYNGAQLDAFNLLVDEFNETVGKDRGIFIESYSQGSVTDLETSVLNAVQGKAGAGEIPNIFAAYADTAYAVDQLGLAADLSQYFTEEELNTFIDSYIMEGQFAGDGSIKIFPVAKSTEIFLLNKTDWDAFAAATGATYEDFSTIEGLTATAQAYYDWTDSLTDEPNDGRAFFGRDAMANYFLVGAMQLGTEIFSVKDGKMTLHFEKDVLRKIWDNYYVPYVKGYFASSGRFRSDDVKTGNIISFVGSSSGATFFPDEVIVSDTESYAIEMEVFPCPQFAGGEAYAVQQGAGMVVTQGTEAEVYASVQFLKWLTQDERNITFSIESGYMPVTKSANNIDTILSIQTDTTDVMKKILSNAISMVTGNTLYTPKAFKNGTTARSILEYSMSDLAAADRAAVLERLSQGQTLDEASADFTSDAHFDAWYQETLQSLEALEG